MRLYYWIILSFLAQSSFGQEADTMQQELIPFYARGHQFYHLADRYDVQQREFRNIHTAIRRLSLASLRSLESNVETNSVSGIPHYPLLRKGFLSTFYKNPLRLFEVQTPAFKLGINLVAHFKGGRETEEGRTIFKNTRGIELYGSLDDRLYFYSTYHENQSNLLNYQQPFIDSNKSFRGYGNYKIYQSSVIQSFNGYDYGYAEAYLGYNLSKHSRLSLGHGNHFIGNGLRSLLLDDSGPNYFYLKLDVQVWKLHYQSIWAELSTLPARLTPNNILLPKKYMASHYFSIKPRQNIELGFFETIIFSRENQFELQYLNPVIFYRTIELQLDSPDNVLLGLNFKWNLYKQFSFYSQFVLDEFNLGQLTSGNAWWGNKFGYQFGIKYFDVAGIDRLDLQLETNTVRPYTYSHGQKAIDAEDFSVANFSHYGQPLAHPLGANFSEYLARLLYQPLDALVFELRYLHTIFGQNTSQNFGADILIPNDSRISDTGILQNQGARSTINMLDFKASYELTYNLFIDLQLLVRSDKNQVFDSVESRYFGVGFRYNYTERNIDY